jgi:hypothetical protein
LSVGSVLRGPELVHQRDGEGNMRAHALHGHAVVACDRDGGRLLDVVEVLAVAGSRFGVVGDCADRQP